MWTIISSAFSPDPDRGRKNKQRNYRKVCVQKLNITKIEVLSRTFWKYFLLVESLVNVLCHDTFTNFHFLFYNSIAFLSKKLLLSINRDIDNFCSFLWFIWIFFLLILLLCNCLHSDSFYCTYCIPVFYGNSLTVVEKLQFPFFLLDILHLKFLTVTFLFTSDFYCD